jgi:hypothetical protein
VSTPVRRGGRTVDAAGRSITWSVAEGRRGRRWRWSVLEGGGSFVAGHTVELDPDGRFVRLESMAASGLLSLHREADGSIHGNRVTAGGIDHLRFLSAPELVIVGGDPVGLAAAVGALVSTNPLGTSQVLEVGDDLGVRVVEGSIRRLRQGAWELRLGQAMRNVRLDALGLPLEDGSNTTSWPLEGD